MSRISINIEKFRAVIFDVDGVLSQLSIGMDANGIPVRTVNVRDGYALSQASKCGIVLGIITGGFSENIPLRYEPLGIQHIYMRAKHKTEQLDDFIAKTGIRDEEIIYVGDDIPDIPVMRRCGLAVAPADAAPEAKEVANYISPVKGGMGVARDVLEQLLKSKGHWLHEESFGW